MDSCRVRKGRWLGYSDMGKCELFRLVRKKDSNSFEKKDKLATVLTKKRGAGERRHAQDGRDGASQDAEVFEIVDDATEVPKETPKSIPVAS